MEHLYKQNITDALKILRRCIPGVQDKLGLDQSKDIAGWTQIVDGKLLTRLSFDFPIMATICGGGSSGKSSLFNSMVGEGLSPVGGSAGLNRRVLASMHREIFNRPNVISALFEPFGCLPDPLKNTKDLSVSGHPLYVLSDAVPQNLVLMDTPDFDTGAKGIYINRDTTLKALESSDILIYVFTNSNYNNRENTDFISEMLTGIGMRKCFLVYRVYPSFEKDEVQEHAMTVARNLYGKDA
ncbi:MAG: 50S ribosome-binding GTPase, partial [Desulfobacterales bacterium]